VDESKFDDLTRFMAETPSRRTVVKALVGAIAGSLASVGTALGAPRCKRVNQACQTTADCCPGPTANGNVYCKQVKKSTKICATCPPETPTACNGGCVDTSTDSKNCGTCGNVCLGGTTCVNGSCRCPAGQHLCADGSCKECCADSHCDGGAERCCNGICRNLDGSNENCGACGHVCPAGTDCMNGSCVCLNGQHLCADGSCRECCTFEHCVPIIGPGEGAICCDGTCKASRFNQNNCGGCGIVCAADQVCVDGDCTCPNGQAPRPDGTCTCGGAECSAAVPCCDGYYCNFGVCLACEPIGGSCENSGDPGRPQNVACCSGMCDPSTLLCI
jgi:hypothetical protein